MAELFNRITDSELVVAAATAVTTTASTTAVAIPSIGTGDEDLGIIINVSSVTGTFDGSNYYTVDLMASTASGGTYYKVVGVDISAVGVNLLAFNTKQVQRVVGSESAAYYKLTVTKTGTTATGTTVSGTIVKGD